MQRFSLLSDQLRAAVEVANGIRASCCYLTHYGQRRRSRMAPDASCCYPTN
jgi:hypothetical protein